MGRRWGSCPSILSPLLHCHQGSQASLGLSFHNVLTCDSVGKISRLTKWTSKNEVSNFSKKKATLGSSLITITDDVRISSVHRTTQKLTWLNLVQMRRSHTRPNSSDRQYIFPTRQILNLKLHIFQFTYKATTNTNSDKHYDYPHC